MKASIPVVEGNTTEAIQRLLKTLLESGLVDALLVPMRTPAGTVTPALVSDPQLLEAADPLAPVLPVNGATLAGKLSVREPRGKVGVVLRACEMRALVELTKMQQASLDSLVLISVDCAGTYSVPEFQRRSASNTSAQMWQELIEAATHHPDQPVATLRQACQICEQPVYDGAQIRIELFGTDYAQHLALGLSDDWAAALNKGLTIQPAEEENRQAIVQQLVERRIDLREAEFAKIRQQLGDEGEAGEDMMQVKTLTGVFAACIRCHNCMTVCPICYCKTCVFKSEVFDHEPMQFINWAQQKGAYRLPADSMLFHMTRLNHMGLSCVGCGMCTEACPAELPVGMVFRAIGQRLQQTFDYAPGRSVDETLPLITFKADEWSEVGE
jgi:formate dehydrogenase (coenzyme F420) beta subunit